MSLGGAVPDDFPGMVSAQSLENFARHHHLLRAAVVERTDPPTHQQHLIRTEKVGGPFDHARQPTHG